MTDHERDVWNAELSAKANERCALERVADHLEKRAGELFVAPNQDDVAKEVRTLARLVRAWAEVASKEQSIILAKDEPRPR